MNSSTLPRGLTSSGGFPRQQGPWVEQLADLMAAESYGGARLFLIGKDATLGGLIRRRGTDVERTRDWPSRPEAPLATRRPHSTGRAFGLPGLDGPWEEVSQSEAEEFIVRWRRVRLAQLGLVRWDGRDEASSLRRQAAAGPIDDLATRTAPSRPVLPEQ